MKYDTFVEMLRADNKPTWEITDQGFADYISGLLDVRFNSRMVVAQPVEGAFWVITNDAADSVTVVFRLIYAPNSEDGIKLITVIEGEQQQQLMERWKAVPIDRPVIAAFEQLFLCLASRVVPGTSTIH
jgi:hypothetical protein